MKIILYKLYFLTFLTFNLLLVMISNAQTIDKPSSKPTETTAVKTPGVEITLDREYFAIPCYNTPFKTGDNSVEDLRTKVRVLTKNFVNDDLTYTYIISGGVIIGKGAMVIWDFQNSKLQRDNTIKVIVDDGKGVNASSEMKTLGYTIWEPCAPPCRCPGLNVTSSNQAVNAGENVTFTANVYGGSQSSVTYNWTVSTGKITGGQGTPVITVSADPGDSVTATVEINGACADCQRRASATADWLAIVDPKAYKIDEFGKQGSDQIKFRLDALFIALNNDPSATGVIINYGTMKEKALLFRVINQRMVFIKFPKKRIIFVDGGKGPIKTELWVTPQGASLPTPSM